MDFYCIPPSAPSRTVFIVAKALGLELNIKPINFEAGDHLKPEFLKINPQHRVPTLVDNGFALWESRAIIVYLVEKYGGVNNPLYPSDPQTRALINQRLYFDLETLFPGFSNYYYPLFSNFKGADPELYKKVETSVEFLNAFLEGQKYAAGNSLTLADIALIVTVSNLVACKFDLSKYPNVAKWFENTQKVVPGWEENWTVCVEMKRRFEAAEKSAK